MKRIIRLTVSAGFAIGAAWACAEDTDSPHEKNTDDIGQETDSANADAGETDDIEMSDSEIFDAVFSDPSDDDAAPLFNREEVAEIRIYLPADEWEALIDNAVEEQYTSADVTIMGQEVKNVGLRFKGSYGTLFGCFDTEGNLTCSKLSMKLKFDEYVTDQRFMGLKRLNLNSAELDDTMVRDCMAYDLFRDNGIVSPRCSYAFVYVNDEVSGLYVMIEQIDGRFTDSRFNEGNGNLYKEAWPASVYDYYFIDRIKTNEETAVHTAFKKFSKDMMGATDKTLPDTLKNWVNMNYWLRYMAMDYALANWDGITTFYCGLDWPCLNHNYYTYQEESTDRFWIIPWDLTASFSLTHWLGDIEPWDNLDAECDNTDIVEGQNWYIRPASCDPTDRAIALTDHALYAKAVQQVLDNLFIEDELIQRADDLADLIEPWMEADPDRDIATWQDASAWQKEQFPLLRARLEEALK